MTLFLQCWGGAAYLFSKVLIVRAEFVANDRNLRFSGWLVYVAGIPAWVILLAGRQNWIASAVELAGVPAIILGLVMSWKQSNRPNSVIDWGIRLFTGIMILAGILYSMYTFKGINTVSQALELFLIAGYLLGNYLLAKRNPFAWLMFMVGLISMSILQYIQNKPILCIQQLASLIPASIGFIKCMKKAGKW